MKTAQIKWTNADSKGWIDTFHIDAFRTIGVGTFKHRCQQGTLDLECDVTALISNRIAILDYSGVFGPDNANSDLFMGQTILVFEDDHRQRIKEVFWLDQDDGEIYKDIAKPLR